MARSLEQTGSIEPYFRHVLSEHERIGKLYEAKLGKKMVPYLPTYMTEKYVTDLLASWEELSPKLSLPKMASKSGRLLRLAIDGDNGKGTSLRLIFNRHQDAVYNDMIDGGKRDVGFQQLKSQMLRLAQSGEIWFLAEREDKLNEAEPKTNSLLLSKIRDSPKRISERSSHSMMGRMTSSRKSANPLLSARVFAGQRGIDAQPTDAEKYSREIFEMYQSIFRQLDEILPDDTSQWHSGVDCSAYSGNGEISVHTT